MSRQKATRPPAATTVAAWSWRLAAVLVFFVGLHQAWGLYEIYLDGERLPLGDIARNGGRALELANDIHHLRPGRFLWHLNQHGPFAYSLLLMPFLLIGGPTYAAATLPHVLLFALTPLVLLAVARRIDSGPLGLWAGLLASALWLASPQIRLFAILIQHESAGAFFTLVALLAYGGAIRTDSLRSWRRAVFFALALVLIKFNYGLAWLGTVAVSEILRSTTADRQRWVMGAALYLQPWRRTG